jgi:hypothetical protein
MTNVELSRYAAVAFQSPTFHALSSLERSVIADQVDVAESESRLPPDLWALLQVGYSEMRPILSAARV